MKNQFKINIGTVVLILTIASDYLIMWQVVDYKLIYALLFLAVIIFLVNFWFEKREVKSFLFHPWKQLLLYFHLFLSG